ncbi:hypothetical protein J0A78_06410 [Providencia rettgeri]|uniref:hypothetical protein n=1 Tax=Morganellaceae TaxID=1903414 RepID=UPI0019D4B8C7|nr:MULTISPECIES: hypothetical protein [Morganellaceae]MBN7840134.1 hypothetical protein [Providencia rettgeri]MBN7853046.1 hypothetical protein [Providencia rettgeri]MBN7861133.1 hypothetical protein [Providencia rettgeri]MBN7871390.1 hypothetical protein [Providencia rettgeri]MBN7897601.1 hypothetical protein [Providencia rettgeri]
MSIKEFEFNEMKEEINTLKSLGIPEEHCYQALTILELKRVRKNLHNLGDTADSQLMAIRLLNE